MTLSFSGSVFRMSHEEPGARTIVSPDKTFVKVFGFEVPFEFLMKVAALLFALGILFQRMTTMEERVSAQINTESVILKLKIDALEWRLQRVEQKIP